MRPIDADAFEKFIRKNCTDSLVDLWCELVRRQPTIEAVPIDDVLKVVKEVYHNFSGYDLEHMTKYGNETEEQQHQSYSSMMMYEIAMEFDDLIERIEDMRKGGAK